MPQHSFLLVSLVPKYPVFYFVSRPLPCLDYQGYRIHKWAWSLDKKGKEHDQKSTSRLTNNCQLLTVHIATTQVEAHNVGYWRWCQKCQHLQLWIASVQMPCVTLLITTRRTAEWPHKKLLNWSIFIHTSTESWLHYQVEVTLSNVCTQL